MLGCAVILLIYNRNGCRHETCETPVLLPVRLWPGCLRRHARSVQIRPRRAAAGPCRPARPATQPWMPASSVTRAYVSWSSPMVPSRRACRFSRCATCVRLPSALPPLTRKKPPSCSIAVAWQSGSRQYGSPNRFICPVPRCKPSWQCRQRTCLRWTRS
jgi:hypothetical protein